jgi:hypothetical protein
MKLTNHSSFIAKTQICVTIPRSPTFLCGVVPNSATEQFIYNILSTNEISYENILVIKPHVMYEIMFIQNTSIIPCPAVVSVGDHYIDPLQVTVLVDTEIMMSLDMHTMSFFRKGLKLQ